MRTEPAGQNDVAAIVVGGAGLCLLLLGLALPWMSGAEFTSGCEVTGSTAYAFEFRPWSVIYVVCAGALVGSQFFGRLRAPGRLAVAVPLRLVAVLVAFGATLGAEAMIRAEDIRSNQRLVVRGDVGDCDAAAWMSPTGGFFLSQLVVLVLGLMVLRILPRWFRLVACAGYGMLLLVASLAMPWAEYRAYVAGRVETELYWFTSYGSKGLGYLWGVVTVGGLVLLSLGTKGAARRILAALAIVATVAVLVLLGLVDLGDLQGAVRPEESPVYDDIDTGHSTWLALGVAGALTLISTAASALRGRLLPTPRTPGKPALFSSRETS
ncbi:hypothetical protein ABN028_25520 [Actinopolymorpha sp. B17G11]|uniref:hypothetical protein n=1 Tax=Actinopolymorpha sp. B17G11 TaxID=3160861 RepID=UPI0032E4FDB1